MNGIADKAARVRALTDLDATLLVEAAAGTGKTALIAGRLTMLLANGSEPSSLAAITFTEAAASELSGRVHGYVDTLLAGQVPKPLEDVLPTGVTELQRERLSAARHKLEELTATTIHGFCQTLIHSYSVEADIDPGAQVVDEVHAEIAFDTIFDQWLRRVLTRSVADSPVAILSKEDPTHVVSTMRRLARFRRKHRTAYPVPPNVTRRLDIELGQAVRDFRSWQSTVSLEPATDALLVELETLASFYQDKFDTDPSFELLWQLAHPPRLANMRKNTYDLKQPQLKGAWRRLAGASEGDRLSDEALELFKRVDDCYRLLLGTIATSLVWVLSAQLDEVLHAYAQFKRNAALMDFDDLLFGARDLVKGHEEVRVAIGKRFSQILVDEFQDTDPIQAEILFRIASTGGVEQWEDSTLRSGALFMVGDPKQAIYRFRGADIETYERAREVVQRQHPGNVLHITTSFRSLPDILAHVNRCFETQLSATGQPGYVALTSMREAAPNGMPCVAKMTVDLPPDAKSNDVRDAEAREVAEICSQLVGNLEIADADGRKRMLAPADIALLAPTGTQLHRYEQALDDVGLPYASQAGKNLFERQEIQDLVSLARTLADPLDTLAFGALLRGPLVGLTEQEILDVTALLPADAARAELSPRFSLLTDPDNVSHVLAKETLVLLRDLWRRSTSTTPMLLLSDAIERFQVRPILTTREGQRSNRALANVDVFLETARAYDVRGLKHFVRDVTRDWSRGESRAEGRVEAVGDAMDIVSIHSSKGLEWPVVVLINTITQFPSRGEFVHRASDNTLHWVLGDVVPADLNAALQKDEEGAGRERERLFYVAFTRARDLLILPKVPHTGAKGWTRVVHDPFHDIPELNVSTFMRKGFEMGSQGTNEQSAELFAQQQRTISENVRHVTWIRPSLDDLDRVETSELLVSEAPDAVETPVAVGAGRVRGLVLHKLMEEVLSGELGDHESTLVARASVLLSQLDDQVDASASLPDPKELGSTIARTLELPDIAQLRPGLVAEVSVFSTLRDAVPMSMSGRADAVYCEGAQPKIVIDWKSDVKPTNKEVELHAAQLRIYMRAMQAERGALVYFSSGKVHWLTS